MPAPRTYREVIRIIVARRRDFFTVREHFGLADDDAVDAAIKPLREAKVVQTIQQLFSGARDIEKHEDIETEA